MVQLCLTILRKFSSLSDIFWFPPLVFQVHAVRDCIRFIVHDNLHRCMEDSHLLDLLGYLGILGKFSRLSIFCSLILEFLGGILLWVLIVNQPVFGFWRSCCSVLESNLLYSCPVYNFLIADFSKFCCELWCCHSLRFVRMDWVLIRDSLSFSWDLRLMCW